jgi:L-threonylcarbamoyladenylate synthase
MLAATTPLLLQAPHDLPQAVNLLRAGQVVAIPTETVFGLAALANHDEAVQAVFTRKRRPLHKPLIAHIGQQDKDAKSLQRKQILGSLSRDQIELFDRLSRNFWPGPLSIILPRGSGLCAAATSGLPYVAVRMPDQPDTLDLIDRIGFPLVAPSANLFSKLSPTRMEHLIASGIADYILKPSKDGLPIGIESTMLSLTQPDRPVILRPGPLSLASLEAVLNRKVFFDLEQTQKASGQCTHHYQPDYPLLYLKSPFEQLSPHALNWLKEQLSNNWSEVVVSSPERIASFEAKLSFNAIHCLSDPYNEEKIAQNLFAKLASLGQQWKESRMQKSFLCVVEPMHAPYPSDELPQSGLLSAVHDRLTKAKTHDDYDSRGP